MQQRGVAEAGEQSLMKGLIFLGEGFAAQGARLHPVGDAAQRGDIGVTHLGDDLTDERDF